MCECCWEDNSHVFKQQTFSMFFSNSYNPTPVRQYQSDLDRMHSFVLFLYMFALFSSADSWQTQRKTGGLTLTIAIHWTISNTTVIEILVNMWDMFLGLSSHQDTWAGLFSLQQNKGFQGFISGCTSGISQLWWLLYTLSSGTMGISVRVLAYTMLS